MNENFSFLADLVESGFSGYGRFSVDNFTHKRIITVHPHGREYPICN